MDVAIATNPKVKLPEERYKLPEEIVMRKRRQKKRIEEERRKRGTEKERTHKYNLIWKVQNHKNEGFMEEEFEMNLEG